ncbi:MAG: hypothetical protein ACK5P5_10340 [Pseudobdellovibrionaceae bacterium]
MNYKFLFFVILLLESSLSWAQQVEVGRKAASKYFEKNSADGGDSVSTNDSDKERGFVRRKIANDDSSGSSDHYLQLHAGKFMSGDAWGWGQSERQNDVGEYTLGLTYKFDHWGDYADLNLRVDFSEYKVLNKKPFKMSFLPLVLFPDSGSRFPLYFGAGVGVGVFFKQVEDESTLSLDYQLVAGARFFDVFENGGFFIETGLKNHLQLLNSGQFNGTFLAVGALFTF